MEKSNALLLKDLFNFQANRHLLPCAFMDMQKYVDYEISNKEDFESQRVERNWIRYDARGFRENLVPLRERDVVRSHDSIWHLSEEYRNSEYFFVLSF